jgi:hypothetical protein
VAWRDNAGIPANQLISILNNIKQRSINLLNRYPRLLPTAAWASTAESTVRLRPDPTFVQRFPRDLLFLWCLGTLFEAAQARPREELLSSFMRRVRPFPLRLGRENMYRRRSYLDSSPYLSQEKRTNRSKHGFKSTHVQRKADAATFSLDRSFMRREQLLRWSASALRFLARSLPSALFRFTAIATMSDIRLSIVR